MRTRGFLRVFAAMFLFCLLALSGPPLEAQTTGGIVGRVTDENGSPLPGVTVQVESRVLQGSRVAMTDSNGDFRLALLPPGDYLLDFQLAGFAPERQTVPVGLDRDTTVNGTLHPSEAEEITVVSDAAVIDLRSNSLGTNLDQQTIQSLPTGRNYSSMAQFAPGVASDANPENSSQSTITVYGSSGAENTYIVDGVNTTGVEYGFQGKELNFEFVEAIDIKTGGYEAEYGRSTGGVINVITKSGGNEFKGDVFGYFDDDSLQANADTIVSTGGTVDGFRRQDFGADLGGYIVKDRLWFFAAYDRVSNTVDTVLPAGPAAGDVVESTSDRDLGAAKLTFNLTEGQSLVGTFFQDPRDDAGAINDPDHRLNGEPLTYLGKQAFGGRDYALRYDGLVGSSWVLNAQASRHEEENSIGPASAAGDIVELRDSENDFFQSGGFGLIQQKEFQRDAYGGSVAKYLSRHELKFGLELESEKATVVKRMSGGQRVDILANPAGGPAIFRHFYWTTPLATVDDAPTSALVAPVEHENTTSYLQDRWQVTSSFGLNLGVRWDRQEIFDRFGRRVIDLKEDFAPRIGFTWSPEALTRSKLYGSYGQYYEQIPMDLVIRSFAQERQARIFNYDPFSTTPDAQAEADIESESQILGGYTEEADPDLKNQYINEFLLGYEREVLPDVAVGAKLIYRDYGRVIEDFVCTDAYDYCIGNPGKGIMRRIFTYDVSTTFPAPEAKRVFKGVQIDAHKRFSDNWQGLVSYVYSKLDGNFDGEYAPFTNVGADPNISAAYDYFDFFTDGRNFDRITNDGPLSNDRRHQLKFSGYYVTDFNLSIGVAGYYRTGTPLTRYGYSDGYGRYEFFLTKRGAEGRSPDTYEADIHLGYPLDLGPVELNFMLDIFNILDAQRPILIDQRWGFQEADNFSPTPVNPGYGRPILRTSPTTARVGVRLSF
jgi:hypothetical protein